MVEPDEDNTAWRRTLRRDMVAKRSALGDDRHASLSAGIVGHLLAALAVPRVVAFCWPIKHEPDAGGRGALGSARRTGVCRWWSPRHHRWHFAWTFDTPLVPDRYGIPTPVTGDFMQPDLILLPLNGFDAPAIGWAMVAAISTARWRRSPRPLAVGVGFEVNRLPSIRPESHDQRLDWS
jgi:5-formyltetrahydrofolate cyclo-ligase